MRSILSIPTPEAVGLFASGLIGGKVNAQETRLSGSKWQDAPGLLVSSCFARESREKRVAQIVETMRQSVTITDNIETAAVFSAILSECSLDDARFFLREAGKVELASFSYEPAWAIGLAIAVLETFGPAGTKLPAEMEGEITNLLVALSFNPYGNKPLSHRERKRLAAATTLYVQNAKPQSHPVGQILGTPQTADRLKAISTFCHRILTFVQRDTYPYAIGWTLQEQVCIEWLKRKLIRHQLEFVVGKSPEPVA